MAALHVRTDAMIAHRARIAPTAVGSRALVGSPAEMARPIWDPAAECGDPAGEAAEVAARLPAQLAHVQATSPFYRALWEEAGVDAARVVVEMCRLVEQIGHAA